MIKVQSLNKSFGDKHVLKDISCVFQDAKVNLIIGQSGSGKTVLVKSLTGLVEPDSGSVYYDDKDLVAMSPKEKKNLRKELGMVFQGGALFDSINVEDNVRFPLEMFSKMSKIEMQKRVDFCLDRVGVDAAKSLPAEISGGMQKRVAIARAIALNPQYLFCDEPNSGLDPQTSKKIDELLSEITHDFGITTVINTHDMNSVVEIGECIVFLNRGQIAWRGEGSTIFESDNEMLKEFIFANKQLKELRDLKKK
ncbi:MAG: ABC transporter ATP-binding protein [Bacteroidales bacterium]